MHGLILPEFRELAKWGLELLEKRLPSIIESGGHGLLKAYGILSALICALLVLPAAAHAQAVGSVCTLERAIDFVITQDNGDFVDLKLSAGEVLRVVGGDAESRRVLWGLVSS